jgi:HlyD family secretion protein
VWQFQLAQVQNRQAEIAIPPEISTVTALGRLEPSGEVLHLMAPTSTQESRIEQLFVQEGDRVESGQLIAILDNHSRLQAELQQAEEQVRIAQAQLAQVQAGAQTGEIQAQQAEIARLEAEQMGRVNAQRATVARLEAEVQNARVEYERYEFLFQEGAVTASQRDAKQLSYTTTQQQLQSAQEELVRLQTTGQAQIRQARATLEQVVEVRGVDVAVIEAQVQSAIATVASARVNLEQSLVRSPRLGQILRIHTHPGETIADQGIVTLGQTEQMMVVAEVYQNDIAAIQIGQTATVTSTALPNSLEGTVERIGLQVEPQQAVDEDPAANLDNRVVEVYIRLNPQSSRQVAGLTNLQVTTTIHLD